MSCNLWVGNVPAGVSDSHLKAIFEKHGGVDSVSCYSLRNYAFVYMKNATDARRAKDNLHGVVLCGQPLKIDFAKPAKPCSCLWVSAISTSISKEDLEEEFSEFGKIEDLKFNQHKHVATINYGKLDDAVKALKAMHGKKIGGTTIRVDYSRSHSTKSVPPSEGPKWNKEVPSNILCISYPPAVNLDKQMLHNTLILFGEIENFKTYPSRHCLFVKYRSMEEAIHAKNGLQGKLFNDSRISVTFSKNVPAPNQSGIIGPRPIANEIPFLPLQSDAISQPVVPSSFHGCVIPHGVGGPFSPNFGGPESSNQMLSSPSMSPLTKSTPGTRDAFDASQSQGEPKRLRSGPHVKNGVHANAIFTSRSTNIGCADVDYMWRGIIARGGAPVCRARCIPIGDWIGYEMPEIVNCSARTGLDMLAKHFADAIGFDIVFFIPDSEEDLSSYTEYLQYMTDLNRAGVAKFGDGTTLFLVPPSDFLKTALKVSVPDRLYGVVLKFPSHTSDKLSGPSITQRQLDRVPPVTTTSAAPAGLSLTPELVASLASLAKVNSDGQQPSGDRLQEQRASNLTDDIMRSKKVNDLNLAAIRNSCVQDSYSILFRHDDMAPAKNSSFHTSQGVEFAKHQADLHTAGDAVTSSSQVADNANVHESQQRLESDADKNERYQATLQLAANLLLQIQQKQSGAETGGSH